MPATVPLSSPVTSVAGAQALAESAALAGAGEPVGPAIDRVVLFLHTLAHPALEREAARIDDVLDLLAIAGAAWAAGWLAGHADEAPEAGYWAACRTGRLVAA